MFSKLTVSVKNNKTLEFVQDNPISPVFSSGFLLVFLVLGIFLNALVFFSTFFTSLKLKSFNRLLACFSVTLILDCVMNISSSIVFLSSWEELYSLHEENTLKLFCSLNATSLQFVSVLELYVLSLISYERWIVMRKTGNEDDGVKLKVVVPWAIVGAGVASLPVRLLTTRYMEHRYSCSATNISSSATQIIPAVLIILIGFCFPLVITVNAWRYITTTTLRERRRVNSLTFPFSHNSSSNPPPYSGTHNILAGVLIVLYFILVVPNTVLVQTSQFFYSHKDRQVTNGLLNYFVGNKTELPEELKPVHTNTFDTVCVWGRYSYALVAPCVIIIKHKYIWEKIKDYFELKQRVSGNPVVKKRVIEDEEEVNWRVPVLFATSNGMYLRIPDLNSNRPKFQICYCDVGSGEMKEIEEEINFKSNKIVKPVVVDKEKRRMSQRRVSDVGTKPQNEVLENQKFKETENELLNTSKASLLLTLQQRIRPRDA